MFIGTDGSFQTLPEATAVGWLFRHLHGAGTSCASSTCLLVKLQHTGEHIVWAYVGFDLWGDGLDRSALDKSEQS